MQALLVVDKTIELPAQAGSLATLIALKLLSMPTGANAYIFAIPYQRMVNPVSGAVALCTLLAAVTLPDGGGALSVPI